MAEGLIKFSNSELYSSDFDSEIFFAYFHITQELVYYGLKKQVGRFVFQAADLLFSTLFQHEIFAFLIKDKPEISKKTLATNKNFGDFVGRWVTTSFFMVF